MTVSSQTRIQLFASVAAVVALGCGHASPTPSPTDASGTYANSSGAVLVVTNASNDVGFDFHLVINSDDACTGVDYKGSATYSAPGQATSGSNDVFKKSVNSIRMEPSVEMIGMECARVMDVEFARQR